MVPFPSEMFMPTDFAKAQTTFLTTNTKSLDALASVRPLHGCPLLAQSGFLCQATLSPVTALHELHLSFPHKVARFQRYQNGVKLSNMTLSTITVVVHAKM